MTIIDLDREMANPVMRSYVNSPMKIISTEEIGNYGPKEEIVTHY